MARIRTIKPEFWTDDRVGECSPSARLLFLASLNFADDHGGLDRSAKQLKAQAFPYDQIDCEPLVQELLKVGLLAEYEVSGKKYLHIIGFRKHQKVERPALPRYPVYDPSLRTQLPLTEGSPSPTQGLEVSSLEGNGREGNGSIRGAALKPAHESLPLASWQEWLEYRRKHRYPMTPMVLNKHLALLSSYSPAEQRAIIDNSIQAGWQGLFHPKGGKPPKQQDALSTWQPPPEDDDVHH